MDDRTNTYEPDTAYEPDAAYRPDAAYEPDTAYGPEAADGRGTGYDTNAQRGAGPGYAAPDPRAELRQRALTRLEERRGFWAHLLSYLAVNALLVFLWWSGDRGFFWPIFPILFWGIGIASHGISCFGPGATEERIEREMRRLEGR